MAKKSSIAKQKRREKKVASRWEQRQSLKKIIKNINTPDEERFAAIDKLNSLPRDSSPTRLRNRCSFTGRPRGFLRKFGLSRHCFREMASFGMIPGVTKASW